MKGITAKSVIWRVGHRVERACEGPVVRVISPKRLKRLAVLPSLPPRARRRYAAPRKPWEAFATEPPTSLRSSPGVVRHPAAEVAAYRDDPLYSFHHNFGGSVVWSLGKLWRSVIPVAPRLMRAIARVQQGGAAARVPDVVARDAETVGDSVRRHASELGISAVAFVPYDERYTFVDMRGEPIGQNVIVCVLEQNWAATQQLPGVIGERTALSTNAELMQLAADLAARITAEGYKSRAHTTEGFAVVHHYAVQGGLGQLGFNGQLLTPQAGSRCRLSLITTTAPLVHDQPRDYGIPRLCESCRVCVRRCPSGAIPARRAEYRGVEKNKLNLARCFPVVAQASGCSVCMKVCPVQRYGLAAVLGEFEQNGSILGRDTDELEGYNWPLDGRHYGPRERPHLPEEFFDVPGFGRLASQGSHKAEDNPLM